MAEVTVRITGDGALRLKMETLSKQHPIATLRAINHTLGILHAQTIKALIGETGLGPAVIGRSVASEEAVPGRLRATLQVTGKRIPLIDLGGKQTARGATYQLGRGSRHIPGAFEATMKSGHRGIFKRQPGAKSKKVGPGQYHGLPISELFGPSLPFIVRNQRIFERLLEPAQAQLEARLKLEVDALLAAGGPRA